MVTYKFLSFVAPIDKYLWFYFDPFCLKCVGGRMWTARLVHSSSIWTRILASCPNHHTMLRKKPNKKHRMTFDRKQKINSVIFRANKIIFEHLE
jgi:hypothetical protein